MRLKRKTPLQRGGRIKRKTRLRKKSSHQKELDALHDLWRLILIGQQGARCQAAGQGTVKCGGPLQAHHVYRKATYPRLRLDLKNGIIVCRNHHGYWIETGPAHEVGAWYAFVLGKRELAQLSIRAAASLKMGRKPLDLALERIYLESQAKKYGVPLEKP